jgi:nicotinamidase-related amidase
MKLLCIVDMQQGFITPECQAIVPNVMLLIEYFSLQKSPVIFTKFLNTPDSPYCEHLGWKGLLNKPEQALLPGLDIYAPRVFSKYGYSIWTKAVSEYLNTQNIETIYFAGLDSDACIYESALQAFDQKIQPIVIRDACTSSAGPDYHAAALKLLKRQIGEKNIISTYDLIDV